LDFSLYPSLSGTIKKSNTFEKNVFLEINEISSITAVGNVDPKKNYSALIGKPITVVGKVTEYEGKKEVMIYSLK